MRGAPEGDTGTDPPGSGEAPEGFLPVLTSVIRRRWTSSVFGIVAPGAVRRRPSDIGRAATAVVVIAAISVSAKTITTLEANVFAVVAALPDGLRGLFEVLYRLAGVVAGVLVVSALVARRWRLLLTLAVAFTIALGVGAALSGLVDITQALKASGTDLGGHSPDFPVVPLAASIAVLLAARPYLTRPTRRMVEVVFWLSSIAAVYLAEGLPVSVLASVVLSWGAAAIAHFALGSPGGTPAVHQVAGSLRELGVPSDGLALAPEQSWGHTAFVSATDDRLAVEVVGRDSTDARLFAKLWRSVWYKDTGPTVTLRRGQQVEHQALVLLLAERSGAMVPDLLAVGIAGARDDALLVVRNPPGRPLANLATEQISDAVLDDAWANLDRLHAAGIAHGDITAHRVVVDLDDPSGRRTGLVRMDRSETSAPADHMALDGAQLLVVTADLVGIDRSLAAGRRARGDDGLAGLLSYLEPAAFSSRSRSTIEDLKTLLADLRAEGSVLTRTEPPELAALRRFSLGGIFLAAAFLLGLYLLVVQLAGVAAMGDVFEGAIWEWVVATALIAQLPPFSQAFAMLGAVATTLPLRPVTVVQFAQAFTGLVGGTAGNATLSIRFFQKQGLPPTLAVSSGVLNSAAGFVVQITLVVTGLLVTGSSFDIDTDGSGPPGWLYALVIAGGVAVVAVLVIPRLRRKVAELITHQIKEAWDNISGVLSTPRKALELFGGNLISQLLFAMVLGAALHAYGESLPLLQLVIINSFASFIGGAAPVPGGMGVVEAGMIAGFTAAGIPQAEAVAATFTARMFTTYLTPIWGWFAFQWLRRNDYV